MSRNWSHEQTDDRRATIEKSNYKGQGHDRIHRDSLIPGLSATIAMEGANEEDDGIDITAGQKMLSAVAGSLVTSLTSKFL